jgi:hypothetical protein
MTFLARLQRRLRPPIDITDEYVRWLTMANAGMLDHGNLYCFDYAMRNLPSGAPIVEIGSFCGLSTNLLSYYKQRAEVANRIFTSDAWLFEGANKSRLDDGSTISHQEYRDFVKGTFLNNVKMFSRDDLPFAIEKLSDDFFAAWRSAEEVTDVFGRTAKLGGPIAFCYIDGDHTYDAAKRDFENCNEFLEPGGFVLFDDSADGSGWEVCRLVSEIKRGNAYHLVIKNPNYLFRKK